MHRAYTPHATGTSSVTLAPDEAHHVTRVLRLRAGDEISVFDGRGGEWRAVIDEANGGDVRVTLVEPRTTVTEPSTVVTLAVGVLKGDQMDTVVRDATALGVSVIVPVATANVAVPPRARLERWERVAVAAAKQSGRAVVPAVRPLTSFEDVLTDSELLVLCLEPRQGVNVDLLPARPPRATLFVGPEGGWSLAEIDAARARGAVSVTLGPRTLRAELAPAVALSLLWANWGWT